MGNGNFTPGGICLPTSLCLLLCLKNLLVKGLLTPPCILLLGLSGLLEERAFALILAAAPLLADFGIEELFFGA